MLPYAFSHHMSYYTWCFLHYWGRNYHWNFSDLLLVVVVNHVHEPQAPVIQLQNVYNCAQSYEGFKKQQFESYYFKHNTEKFPSFFDFSMLYKLKTEAEQREVYLLMSFIRIKEALIQHHSTEILYSSDNHNYLKSG